MPTTTAKEIADRAKALTARLARCDLCPRNCRVARDRDELGYCRVGSKSVVASYGPHFGEERPLVGRHGSGTVFFSGCNLGCVFCQNHDISHDVRGQKLDSGQIAKIFLAMQELGCHNLNLVTPTHVIPHWMNALALAVERGFVLPVVYNSGGYDSVETLKALDGVVDIYMPDFKYADEKWSGRFSDCDDYPTIAKAAFSEMHRQVGDLRTDPGGVATGGLLVRHLILPDGLAGTGDVLRFIAEKISTKTYVNIMGQYHACHHADSYPELRRRPHPTEMEDAIRNAHELGLFRLD
jgi:putative pyruvate formate lyase activating enzyme